MKRREDWLLLALGTWLVCESCWATECRFFRIECPGGAAPENLAITMDESGQTFLEFDTVEGNSYSIEATDSLSPPAWSGVWTLTGDGQRATWLTTSLRWSRTFGGIQDELGFSVGQTSDGGYIVAGVTYSFGAGNGDVHLIKTDANGDEAWSRTFGGTDDDWAESVQQTTDGGYILAGSTESFGAGSTDVYLIKTNANGDAVKGGWSRTFGGSAGDAARSVHQTTDGGYIVAGQTESFGSGSYDIYLIKTDANGDEAWSRTFGLSERDDARSVRQTSDGGYIVAGTTLSFGSGSYDVYLIKTDGDGNEVWSKTFGGTDGDDAYSVQQTSHGGYIVAGTTLSFGSGPYDVYLIKTDGDGNEVWSKTFGGTDGDEAYSVQQTTDGGYIVAGNTLSFGASAGYRPDVYLIKTDSEGNELWSRTFGGWTWDQAWSVQQTSDGGYIVAGTTFSFGAGLRDVYLIKTDANGNTPPPK